MTTKYIDYLTEDPLLSGQSWVCVSFLSPEGIKNCSVRGLKIRGVFSTREEADRRAKYLHDLDSDFHVFVGEMGKWLPWDPDPSDIEDQVYKEKELNDLMKGYKDNQTKAKVMQQQRKSDMIQKAAIEEQSKTTSTTSTTRNRLQKKLAKRKQASESSPSPSPDESVVDLQSLANEELSNLKQIQNNIQSSTDTISSVDEKMAKIKALYDNLNK